MKKNTKSIRVHADFEEFTRQVKENFKKKLGFDLTDPQVTKIIVNNSRDLLLKLQSIKNESNIKKKNLKKRRIENDLFQKPF